MGETEKKSQKITLLSQPCDNYEKNLGRYGEYTCKRCILLISCLVLIEKNLLSLLFPFQIFVCSRTKGVEAVEKALLCACSG